MLLLIIFLYCMNLWKRSFKNQNLCQGPRRHWFDGFGRTHQFFVQGSQTPKFLLILIEIEHFSTKEHLETIKICQNTVEELPFIHNRKKDYGSYYLPNWLWTIIWNSGPLVFFSFLQLLFLACIDVAPKRKCKNWQFLSKTHLCGLPG